MSITHTATFSVTEGTQTFGNIGKGYSAPQEVNLDLTGSNAIANAVTNQEHDFTITVADIVSVILVSDQTVTLKFDSTGSPTPSIVLVANVPYVWNTDSYFTNILSTNITKVYITNASGTAANIVLRFAVSGQ